ncbi:hypothetical protein H310_03891 [Aphanomyces invadans]|uniref:Uncharacterized protein n=1 Tax=Aphanomyces invadans TaxID=157072 RepID=A0A024UGH4_9STRA|nr:hypothetical protein H310_03891 [Aphanomyces invadans]ETW04743.1 hypothetical protein H310_03891 [Aphanomyces invadans]|eukprot:XP_008866181.1 hypothetical protein H310_03891 [Aphanomyces invadans]
MGLCTRAVQISRELSVLSTGFVRQQTHHRAGLWHWRAWFVCGASWGEARRVNGHAIPWIDFNISNNTFPPGTTVSSLPLMWGPDVTSAIPRPFDVILCSDLIYGDTDLADLLLATIRALSHASTLVVFAHEARYAGNQGRYFLDMIAATHTVDVISYDVLDPIYRATNIHVHLLHPRLADVSDAADPGAATVAKPAGVCVQERHG